MVPIGRFLYQYENVDVAPLVLGPHRHHHSMHRFHAHNYHKKRQMKVFFKVLGHMDMWPPYQFICS